MTTQASRVQTAHSSDGLLTVVGYRGDGALMLAFDVASRATDGLAGFAIFCTPPKGNGAYLSNRLSFAQPITNEATQHDWTPSNEAPFQKFRWVDYSGLADPGEYTYDVSAMYFAGGGALRKGSTAKLAVTYGPFQSGNLAIGFTRSYVSSQAYARKFQNEPVRPSKTLDYETAPYQPAYEYLGVHARRLMFAFLDECVSTPGATVDMFAYDLDEPDIVAKLVSLKGRLRLYLDDASLHTGDTALEPIAAKRIAAAGGAVKRGHFKRFAHDKILILRKPGGALKVLTGSANFSVRGLYVQANSVLVFDDPSIAGLYAQVFDRVWADPSKFASDPLAGSWHDFHAPNIPPFSVAFSPHKDPLLSLGRVANAIQNAKRSVMFAIMELEGGGPVLADVVNLAARDNIYSYGVTQSAGGVKLFSAGSHNGTFTPFAFLNGTVPPPFDQETSGGAGQVIHHKFVVTDFNDLQAAVFMGSSNLASGGESDNGDNLLAFTDPEIATIYGVEAIRLVDHFHFRAVWQNATTHQPLVLQGATPAAGAKHWWEPYYDPGDGKSKERLLLSTPKQSAAPA